MTTFDIESYLEALEIHGIILSGGNDLSVCSDDELSVRRDTFEKQLLESAIAKRIPVIGICRGMQFLAAYFGATLQKVDDHTGIHHKVELHETSTFLNTMTGLKTVNSYHQYAITAVPKELASMASAEDKTIEAFYHRSLPIAGMMWHPERNDPFIQQDLHFFNHFFNL